MGRDSAHAVSGGALDQCGSLRSDTGQQPHVIIIYKSLMAISEQAGMFSHHSLVDIGTHYFYSIVLCYTYLSYKSTCLY